MSGLCSITYDPETGACYRTLAFLGFPAYRVGDDGSVWTRFIPGPGSRIGTEWRRLKSVPVNESGHQKVTIRSDHSRQILVHHLVLFAFVGPAPDGMVGRHFPDRDPRNNHLDNLSWSSFTTNQQDRVVHGNDSRGEKNGQSKTTSSTVL